jgi:hypothetical protein
MQCKVNIVVGSVAVHRRGTFCPSESFYCMTADEGGERGWMSRVRGVGKFTRWESAHRIALIELIIVVGLMVGESESNESECGGQAHLVGVVR